MKNTKQEIINAAILLFNQSGFRNVTLSQIALKIGISNGNLNYHFQKKDDLIRAIFYQMEKEINEVFNYFSGASSIKGILEQIIISYSSQLKYRFFFQDTLEIIRAYPKIAKVHHKEVLQYTKHIRRSLAACVAQGIFRPEPFLGAYDYLAHSLWLHSAFWLNQLSLLQNDSNKPEIFAHSIASLFYPHLTPKGLSELEAINYLDFVKNISPINF